MADTIDNIFQRYFFKVYMPSNKILGFSFCKSFWKSLSRWKAYTSGFLISGTTQIKTLYSSINSGTKKSNIHSSFKKHLVNHCHVNISCKVFLEFRWSGALDLLTVSNCSCHGIFESCISQIYCRNLISYIRRSIISFGNL